ncbi:AAA family ATPase [Pseudomonas mosselii]|uniref:AAA family ATPase n=1 Tax=Pseudomonas mosselii TaxID=78327 RepID=UPI001F25C1E6|nr:ATP-binding protein [Pseudomonas mosselii]
MEVYNVIANSAQVTFKPSNRIFGNKIDLITGVNGSGKTEILSIIANVLGREVTDQPSFSLESTVQVSRSARPSHVITQTFSPFSRFPAPSVFFHNTPIPIRDPGYISNPKYLCIGFHSAGTFSTRNLGKSILEHAIYRISRASESIKTILRTMHNLGFRDSFDINYIIKDGLRRLLDVYSRQIPGSVERWLHTNWGLRHSMIRNELNAGRTEFAELLKTALGLLRQELGYNDKAFYLKISSLERGQFDLALLQSLALLRRLGLLELDQFLITTQSGAKIEVSGASSGQQQMLCSIIGLATALRDDSVVLIDEPELSLHPQWQQTYLDTLISALEPFRGCHVIVATHSPLIVQRGLQLGVGVSVLNRPADRYTDTYGVTYQSVEETLIDVFHTPVPDSFYLANEILTAVVNAESGTVSERRKAISDLLHFKAIYSSSSVDNASTLEMIDKALAAVGE